MKTTTLKTTIKQLQGLEKVTPGMDIIALSSSGKVQDFTIVIKKVFIHIDGHVEILSDSDLQIKKDTLEYYTDHSDLQIWQAMSQDEKLCYHDSFKELQESNARLRKELVSDIEKYNNAKSIAVMQLG